MWILMLILTFQTLKSFLLINHGVGEKIPRIQREGIVQGGCVFGWECLKRSQGISSRRDMPGFGYG
jgi:hypothetical protein